MTTAAIRILGIDPGYGRLGIAVLERRGSEDEILYSECFETAGTKEFPERLKLITQELRHILEKWQPTVCGIEKLYFQKNKKTAMRVAETRGAILSEVANFGTTLVELSPQEIKIAITGHGGAAKKDVAFMIGKLVKLPSIPKHDDEYDAIACSITASRQYSFLSTQKTLNT